jgi:hypothetical protein
VAKIARPAAGAETAGVAQGLTSNRHVSKNVLSASISAFFTEVKRA